MTTIEWKGEKYCWAGAWPAKKNSSKLVAVLAGTSHAGIMEVCAEYLGTHRDKHGSLYDWYRLPQGARIYTDPVSAAAATMGRKGGAVKSEAKTTAARENGKRGGRPKQQPA